VLTPSAEINKINLYLTGFDYIDNKVGVRRFNLGVFSQRIYSALRTVRDSFPSYGSPLELSGCLIMGPPSWETFSNHYFGTYPGSSVWHPELQEDLPSDLLPLPSYTTSIRLWYLLLVFRVRSKFISITRYV